MQETPVQFLGQEDPLEKGWATHSSIHGLLWWLSWQRIWLQYRRPEFNPWAGKIPWRRERLSPPVFWSGEFHELYSPWSHKSWTRLSDVHFTLSCVTYPLLRRRSLPVMTDEDMTGDMKQVKWQRPLDVLWIQGLASSFVGWKTKTQSWSKPWLEKSKSCCMCFWQLGFFSET